MMKNIIYLGVNQAMIDAILEGRGYSCILEDVTINLYKEGSIIDKKEFMQFMNNSFKKENEIQHTLNKNIERVMR